MIKGVTPSASQWHQGSNQATQFIYEVIREGGNLSESLDERTVVAEVWGVATPEVAPKKTSQPDLVSSVCRFAT